MNKREPGYANVDPKVKSGKSVKIDLTNTSLDMTSQIEECGKDKPLNWEKNADMTVLCFNLRTMPRPAQFIICCSGVFFFYLVYGYFQVSSQNLNLNIFSTPININPLGLVKPHSLHIFCIYSKLPF